MNTLANLNAVVPEDHKLVDDNPDKYSRQELEKQKAEHEARIARQTALGLQELTESEH